MEIRLDREPKEEQNEQRREYCAENIQIINAENIQIINRNRDEAEMLTIHRKEDHRCIFGCRQDLPGSVGEESEKKAKKIGKTACLQVIARVVSVILVYRLPRYRIAAV